MMFLISERDILPITLVVVFYLMLCSFQMVVFPSNYFSVGDMLYYRKFRTALLATATRISIIWFLAIVLEKCFFYTGVQVVIGISFGSFLCAWPSIYQYRLLYCLRNKTRALYFAACLSSVLFSCLVAYFSHVVLIPMIFESKEFFLLDNNAVMLMYSLLPYILPFGARALFVRAGENPYIDAETFAFDLHNSLQKINFERRFIKRYSFEIEKYAHENEISADLLKTVLLIEYTNRGSWLMRSMEKIVCCLFPAAGVAFDLSVGLAQIKISTAGRLMKCHPKKVAKLLLNDDENIRICARYLCELIRDYDDVELGILVDTDTEYHLQAIYDENALNKMKACLYIESSYLCGERINMRKYVFVYATILYNLAPDVVSERLNELG